MSRIAKFRKIKHTISVLTTENKANGIKPRVISNVLFSNPISNLCQYVSLNELAVSPFMELALGLS